MYEIDSQPEFIIEEEINESTGLTSKKYKIKGVFSTMGEKIVMVEFIQEHFGKLKFKIIKVILTVVQ